MKRKVFLYLIVLLVGTPLYGQKDLPVFTLYGECFLNAGKCNDVIIKDSIAYIGSQAGLLILDVSEPINPEFISCYYTDKFVFKIFINDTLAFVTSFALGSPIVSIIDISNPDNPILINSFETNGYENNSIFIQKNLLFLGLGYSGLFIYDISDLLSPVLITQLPDIKPDDMVVRDGYIYMVANYRYFGIMDISTVTGPELLCWIGDYSNTRSGIDLQGDYVYIAGNTFDIFEIINPSSPNQVCEFEMDYLYDILVNDSICYSMSDDSLFVINIEDPSTPEVLDYYSYIGSYLSFDNNLLVVTKDFISYDSLLGIGFFNIDDTQQISLLAEFITDKAKEVFTEGNYAYVANGYNGLRIINITIPSNPVTISNCLMGFYVIETIVENNFAYVRTSDGLKIVDISNPELPFTISSYNIVYPSSIYSSYTLEKYTNYIYIGGDGFSELYVIDVSDPINPVNVGQINVNDWSPDIEIFDEHLYVAGYWGGLQIFDLANPVNPPMVGYHPLGLALKIAAGKNTTFVGGAVNQYSGGIEIFDVANLSNPIYIGSYEINGTDMQCIDNYLIAGQRGYQDINSSIHVVDILDLNNPVLKQEIMDVAPNGIFYTNERIYVAEDFKFKIFGDSLTVSTNDVIAYDNDLTLSCFPNPAISRTTIKFHVNNKGFIQLTVHNIKGELIANLIHDDLSKGLYSVDWNCNNNSGNKVSPGIYVISLLMDNSHVSKKLILTGN